MADADLEHLLAQLLRAVSPATLANGRAARPAEQEDTPPAADAIPAVSVSEARALSELLAARGIRQGQLAALLGLEKSTVSRLAAGLERKGWIRRGRDGRNQRYVRLYLTPEGTALAGRVWRALQSRQARILASLSPEERAGLTAGLRGLMRGLAAEGLLADGLPPGDSGPAHRGAAQAAQEAGPGREQEAGGRAAARYQDGDPAGGKPPGLRQAALSD